MLFRLGPETFRTNFQMRLTLVASNKKSTG